jgi:surface protein
MSNIIKATNKTIKDIIEQEIEKLGNNADLNHIDVSAVTDMCCLFKNSKFNGDISNWDVSNVKDMYGMFSHSNFNQDISEWNISRNTNINAMLDNSDIDNDNLIKFIMKNYKHPDINDVIRKIYTWQDFIVFVMEPTMICKYLSEFEVEYEYIKDTDLVDVDCVKGLYPEIAIDDIFII